MERRKKSTGSKFVDDHVSKETKRKQMKPITEKIRRERINNSLDELKVLILNALNEDVSHYAKMEKADILEMAVKYIKRLQSVKRRPQAQGEPQQASKAETEAKTHSFANAATTDYSYPKTLNIPTEKTRSQTRPSASGSLDLVLPAIPITFPGVAKETPAFSSSCGSFRSNNVSSSPRGKQDNSLPFPKTCNENTRSPFAVMKQNAVNTASYKEKQLSKQSNEESNNHQKIRLPGMECFIRSNNHKTAVFNRETDKENAASLDDFVHQYQRGFPFDNPQFALTLWRPW